ncbi:hypothetical protein PsYK624_144070 [Phanerochaete sordida]|uniref:FAD-binding PCMH-type domain-containing protein n=1 Tax=Phanerochaete sordida TaxID=48140 RepID=A0A9P3LKB9_9APHY|nr:hypothetical protein PsYK624_144070 [Phanerochaete sordida]
MTRPSPLVANPIHLSQLRDELADRVRGPVILPDDPAFAERSRTFNGKLSPNHRLVVSPLDAQDVSAIVIFCAAKGLSPSIRAGGYGIAGWAVAGDIVVDMSLMREMAMEPPQTAADGTHSWTRLKDMPPASSLGSGRVGFQGKPEVMAVVGTTVPQVERPSAKRRREDVSPVEGPSTDARPIADAQLRHYDEASHAVASFLRGPPLPPEEGEVARQPPTNKRRIDEPERNDDIPPLAIPPLTERQRSGESSASSANPSSGSSMSTDGRTLSTSTAATSPTETPVDSDPAPAPPPGLAATSHVHDFVPSTTARTASQDPFGYLSSGPAAPVPTVYSGLRTFNPPSGPVNMFGRPVVPGVPGNPFASLPPLPGGMPGMSMTGFAPPHAGALAGMGPARPVHTHAYVTVGAGMRQKEIDMYSAENPLPGVSPVSGATEDGLVPYHVPMAAHPTGSSVLFLSGFGFLSRLYGLSVDNLLEVEMVLADGRIVIVSEEEHPELWWAIRGAGPAFGIATRFKVKAYPVPVCFAGNLIYRFHRATAPSLIKHFRDCIKGAPRELYANVLLTAGPADKDSLVVIQMCYLGPKEKGLEYLQAISSWDGEKCLLNEVNEKSFLFQQDSIAQVLRGKAGRQWFLRSSLIHSLPDEVIHKTVLQFADTPIGCTWIFELSGGAIADFEDTCLPKEQREAVWTVAALHQWEMGIDDPRCITTAEDWMAEVVKPVSVGGPLPTFLGRHEPPERTMASYGKHWDRLADLKRKYDPQNMFRNNFWPLDEDGKPIGALYNEPPSPSMSPWQH